MYNCYRGRGIFKSYEMDVRYRVQVNFVWYTYYRKNFKQRSLSQYDNALNIIVDDLHTIVDKICDFTN